MDKMRWRYGDTNSVLAVPWGAERIYVGDLLYQVRGWTRPASALERGHRRAGDLPRLFAGAFLGLAMQGSAPHQGDPIRVATTGVFELDAVGHRAWELGDLVGPRLGLDLRLASQCVRRYQLNEEAIGRVARAVGQGAVSVLVDVVSTVMRGGVLGRWPRSAAVVPLPTSEAEGAP